MAQEPGYITLLKTIPKGVALALAIVSATIGGFGVLGGRGGLVVPGFGIAILFFVSYILPRKKPDESFKRPPGDQQ